ncbi:hypothetical protein [Nonlabens antarcticus]|uniref:hypothetical protein n=1 Tax=Nonlabens antarcticus TaxID=392714 RepID=UPI001890D853|nr:hypothetical protein [Nonlabens antarcticus]
MGIIKDNDDNLEEENLTFFFDGSKKLHEFVENKEVNNHKTLSSSGNTNASSRIENHFISDNLIFKHLDEHPTLNVPENDNKTLELKGDDKTNRRSSAVENNTDNTKSDSRTNSSSTSNPSSS